MDVLYFSTWKCCIFFKENTWKRYWPIWFMENIPFFKMSFVSLFWKMAGSLDEAWNVCLLVLLCLVFCCLHVYVNFLVARKNNLPSDVTGASLLPLPRHLPTAACWSPQWSPTEAVDVSLSGSSLLHPSLCQSWAHPAKIQAKYSRKGWDIHRAQATVQEVPWSKTRAARHHHTERLPPPRQAPCRTRQTPPDRIQAEMFA